jgi:hypothetical protein
MAENETSPVLKKRKKAAEKRFRMVNGKQTFEICSTFKWTNQITRLEYKYTSIK